MQYKIPQDVQRPDTIIGPITFAQLGICLVGGGIAYAIYIAMANSFSFIVYIIPVSIVVILTLAIAFLKIADMTFSRYVLYMAEFLLKPPNRSWSKRGSYHYSILKPAVSLINEKDESMPKITAEELKEKRKKLTEIGEILDK